MATKIPSHTTGDFKGPDNYEIDLSSTLDEIERPDLAVVTNATLDSPHVAEYAKDLAFMDDILEIVVHKSEDKYAPDPITCGVNGVTKVIPRGKPFRMARKFVDALIKTSFRVETVEYTDKAGLQQTKTDHIAVQNCSVQVFHDPAGEVGRRWMEHKLSNSF